MLGALLQGKRGEREILGRDGLLGELTGRLVERALSEELSEHLGYPAGQAPPGGAGNSRNGGTPKTLLTDHGQVRIDVPRGTARAGSSRSSWQASAAPSGPGREDHRPVRRRDDHARDRDYIAELYGPGVSRETVSRVTAGVLEDAKAWQTRPLEQILYLDALVVKIRDGQAVRNFAGVSQAEAFKPCWLLGFDVVDMSSAP